MSSQSEQPRENYVTVGSDMVVREGFVGRLVGQLICDADDSSELRVISVLGERAIGKTALVRSVYDRLDIKRHFKSRAWVRVLVGSGLEDILFDVLRQTTTCQLKDVDCLRDQHLSEMLEGTLIKQRYLVVLDNLQSVDLMEKLLNLFVDTRNGSRVIITTCNENMSLHPGPRHSGHLELCRLTGEESHELLLKCSWTSDPELIRSILRKCNGYPPVIRLLGGLLSTVGEDSRSPLADGISNYCTLGEIISLSYDSLPNWLRPCLLYLVLFPREYEIPVRRLFNIWLADGLLSSQQGRRGREHCTQCLNALVARNIIHVVRRKLDGSAKTCLMPGFLHDFMSEMAMDVGIWEISDDSNATSSREPRVPPTAVKILMSANGEQPMNVRTNSIKVRRQTRATKMSSLSLYSTKHLSCLPPKLQYIAIKMDENNQQCKQMHMSNGTKTHYVAELFSSFMLFTTWRQWVHAKEIETLLKPLGLSPSFPQLKVFDLEHVYNPMLPKRLGKIMPNVRYLGLRWTALVSVPISVRFMSHLDTLDLKHTNVASVPGSILKNGSLQHLYMNEVCLDRSFRGKASYQKSLANLKTLCGLYIGGKSAMLDVLGKLTGLQKLGLTCHYMVAKGVAESVARLTNLQSLRMRSLDIFDHSSRLELSDMSNIQSLCKLHLIGALTVQGLTRLPRNLQILTLSMTRLEEDPMQVLKELNGLTSLSLLADSYTGPSMTCGEGTFPTLRVLKLWKLELLEWTIEASALPLLQELEIRNCTRLTSIVGLEHVQGLEEITLTKVKEVVAVTAEAIFPEAVVIARGLDISAPQEGDDNTEEEDDEESHVAEAEAGDDNDLEESDSNNDRGTVEQADEEQELHYEEDDDKESNGFEHEAGDDNDLEEGDSNVNRGIDEGANEEQEIYYDCDEDDDEEINWFEDEAGDDNDREEGDSHVDRGTDEGADEGQEIYYVYEEDNDVESNVFEPEAGDDNDREERDSNVYRGTNEGADEEQEIYYDYEEDNDEECNVLEPEAGDDNDHEERDRNVDRGTNEGADEEQGGYNDNEEEDEESNGGEVEASDANDREKGDRNDARGTHEQADEEQEGHDDNEEHDGEKSNGFEGEAGDVGDNEDAYTEIEGNDKGEDLGQQNTDEAKDVGQDNYEEREENEEEENENDNEGDNDDEGNEEGENKEQQNDDKALYENENDRDEKVDDGNRENEEEEERQNGAEAEDGERRDLKDDDDEGETKSCKMNMKLELNMETKANVKNELTLTVVWKKTKDDE
ncbi:hypothetical protein BT93_E1719 [Corymbia citriodora subsp. variegata]|nr:hypothetical protein BT93_E1719 [Corymbia citriodora subsp. variegata]KAF8029126.1 hypothetical protein BT93_E1719 [Corymbia citriodora subsp. variegata]